MKKILTILLGIILMLSLFACKGDNNDNSNNSSTQNNDKENTSTQSSTKYPWGDKEFELPEDVFE